MKVLIRWGKFNLVGAMGMVVQLTALALFTRRSDAITCMHRLRPSSLH
jgi:hypothetical protein